MRYKAIAATTNITKESWGRTSEFTHNALIQLMATAKGKPVLLDFDDAKQVGVIESGSVIADNLEIVFILDDDDIVSKHHRLAPGFRVDMYKWDKASMHRIIDNVIMVSCGLINKLMETDLPEIEEMMDEN